MFTMHTVSELGSLLDTEQRSHLDVEGRPDSEKSPCSRMAMGPVVRLVSDCSAHPSSLYHIPVTCLSQVAYKIRLLLRVTLYFPECKASMS